MDRGIKAILVLVLFLLVVANPWVRASWVQDGIPVCTVTGIQTSPCNAPDGAGGSIIAWVDERNGNEDIYAQRMNSSGDTLWMADGVAICTASGDQRGFDIISDGAGGAIITWGDARSGTGDIYAQRIDASGSVQWTTDGVAVCTAVQNQGNPKIVTDGAGGAIITWGDLRSDSGDIYAQRVNASGVAQWAADGVEVCTVVQIQGYQEIVVDGAGGAIITWQDYRSGSSYQIYAERLDASGSSQWYVDGVLICSNRYGTSPEIATDGAGGAIIAFMEGNDEISAQRVRADGTQAWGFSQGVTIRVTAGSVDGIGIVADGAGGAIIAWQDNRSGADIYAQRVEGTSGTPYWTVNGIAVCSATGTQNQPRITSDGGDGAIVVWCDQRSGVDLDIYAQWVDGSGNGMWTTNGAEISTATGNQTSPDIAPTGAGTAILAWVDDRSGIDIYAQATPKCLVSPDSLDFGLVSICDWIDTSFVVKNTGGGILGGTVSESCDHFSVVSGGGAYSLGPGDSVLVTVRFEPAVAGTLFCTVDTGLLVCSDVNLLGVGTFASEVNPASLDFGMVTIGEQMDRSFTITNTDSCSLVGSVEESCVYFSIVSGGGAYALVPGESLIVAVRFEPLTLGAAACTVSTGEFCTDVVCTGAGGRAPRIYAIRDVPGDQGGFINVAWKASPGDNAQEHAVTRYTVWRAIDPIAVELSGLTNGALIVRISDLDIAAVESGVQFVYLDGAAYYWRLISSIEAYYLEGYSEVVPTLFDSTAICLEYHYVQIIAHTSDPYTFWASHPDSCRSVDNLAPCMPCGLAGQQSFVPEGLTLTWDRNLEADLSHYAVYRGESGDFVPSSSNLIASPRDTTHFDGDWRWHEQYYYKISAVDIHGNESCFALLLPEDVTGSDEHEIPRATYLSQNYPNPFNPMTRILFGLREPSVVSLRIYDASGRLVRVLVDEFHKAGHYEADWNGRDNTGRRVASGIYFYRLATGDFVRTKKMVLLR
ncbi:MAG: choice-of-anchor D domain-containing protein [bacterium]|nr:MAG: choice-of-anchor D domain-containing protein [bacterium]